MNNQTDYKRRKVDYIKGNIELMTLLVCLLIGNVVAVLLALSYRLRFPKNGTWKLFITSRVLQLVIVMILLLPGDFSSFRPVEVFLSLAAVAACITESLALLQLLGVCTDRVRSLYYVLGGGSVAGLLLYYALYQGEIAPVVLSSLSGACLLIYPVYTLCVTKRETPLQFVMGMLYAVVMFSLLGGAAESVLALTTVDTPALELLRVFFYIGMYLLMFLGTAGFMLLSREQSYAELERVATYDELTGVLNRRAFELRARPMLAAAAREVSPVTFLLLDVDHFKEVNDTYGHDTGDKVLRDLTRKIEGQLGNGDLFGRFGGEEFAVILHRADEEASDKVAERLRTCILNSVIGGVPLDYTISIGVITVVSKEQALLSTLYKRSDNALYQAKRQGRNCIVRSRETER